MCHLFFIISVWHSTIDRNKVFAVHSRNSSLFSALDINWFYSGLEKFKLISLRSVFVKLVLLIGLLCLVKNKSDLIIYVLLNSLTF